MWPKITILLGGFLRFYKLNWGESYFFHPDEYHIAAAVNRLSFPLQMNPELFSYGSFTVYLIYFTKLLLSVISHQLSAINPILIGRFYSALFSSLTVLIIFLISQRLFKKKFFSCLAAFLTAVMPGLIQQAHFTTPESVLTFWMFLTLYLWIRWREGKKLKFLYLSAASLGLALGTKIVALTFLPILFLLPLTSLRLKTPRRWSASWRILLRGGEKTIKLTILPLLIMALIFFLASPYNFIDWRSFRNTMNYETGVGRGEPIVFYTRQFIETTPILFQYQKILPYALGPAVLILGTLGILGTMVGTVKAIAGKHLRRWRGSDLVSSEVNLSKLFIFLLAFLFYFLPNTLLFAKWTRFIAPSFPFFAIFTAYLLSKIKNSLLRVACYVLLATNLIWLLMSFSIYLRPDVRITTTNWLNQSLPPGSVILTEQGNMVEVPLEGNLKKTSLDFYGLEENLKTQQQLPELLAEADYFIVQSRRLFINHQRLPNQFPRTARFYNLLFSGQMGFEQIKKFDSFPQFWKLKITDESAEETWSVFDHPVIRVYQKVKPLPKGTYEKLLQI